MFVFPQGATSKIIPLSIKDSASTTGGYKTGLTSTSVTVSYARPDQGNAGATTVTLAAGTRGTWSSGGFVEKDATNSKGTYELGIPNAALAAGADWVIITVQDAASNGVAEQNILIMLSDAHRGLGAPDALPAVAAGSSGGLVLLGTALVEAYRANGATGTLEQVLYEILGNLTEKSVSGTTATVKKLDHATTATTLTLNSATAPTSVTRAS